MAQPQAQATTPDNLCHKNQQRNPSVERISI